jgi:CheY-like chemotaxis protein
MAIWLVEDDATQAKDILAVLKNAFPTQKCERMKTEQKFLAALRSTPLALPDVVIFDVMLPWTEIGEDGKPIVLPPEGYEESGGFFRAGIRCAEALWANPATHEVPGVLFTVLTNGDLANDLKRLEGRPAHYLSKKEPPERLAELVRRLIGA